MDPTYTLEYELYELKHWWHVARREIIEDSLDRFILNPGTTRWLDVGCGTGVQLRSYQRISDKMGLEMDAGSVERGRATGLDVRRIDPDSALDAYGTFDLVTACDVIEHIEDDRGAIAKIHRILNPSGTVLITVPAMTSLWSAHDVRNRHFRRYSRSSLLKLFGDDRWRVLKISYFSSMLLPAIWPYRKLKNLREGLDPEKASSDKKFGNPLVDRTLLALFRVERVWLKRANLPLGSSLLLVAQKR